MFTSSSQHCSGVVIYYNAATITADAPTCCTCRLHNLPDVRQLKNSIANAIVNHVTVDRVETVAHLGATYNQPECRILLTFGGGMGSYYYRVRFSDEYNNTTKSLLGAGRAASACLRGPSVASGASFEETRTVHALAFAKLNGAELKQTGQRPSKDCRGVRRPTGSTGGATISGSTGGATTSPCKNTRNRDTTLQMRPQATYIPGML